MVPALEHRPLLLDRMDNSYVRTARVGLQFCSGVELIEECAPPGVIGRQPQIGMQQAEKTRDCSRPLQVSQAWIVLWKATGGGTVVRFERFSLTNRARPSSSEQADYRQVGCRVTCQFAVCVTMHIAPLG